MISRTREHLILAALERTYTIVEIQEEIYRVAHGEQVGLKYALRMFYEDVVKNVKNWSFRFNKKRERVCGFF